MLRSAASGFAPFATFAGGPSNGSSGWKPDISAAALVGRAADFLTKRPGVLKGDGVDAPRASACQGPLIQDFVCGDCSASAAPGHFTARIMSASARLHVDEYCGRATLIGIIGDPARSLFQSQVLSETYPTRLMAISMGMTIGGTNQPFIARLRCSDFLVTEIGSLYRCLRRPVAQSTSALASARLTRLIMRRRRGNSSSRALLNIRRRRNASRRRHPCA
jgi:hypothetical protein